MELYAGFEPQVGEIRALRTFRVGPGGVLYAVATSSPWQDGVNTARCRAIGAALEPGLRHDAPAPGCTCGFYAYGNEESTHEYPFAKHVLAVVACWGRVIAGTRGIRAQHCRIDALWLSSTVPPELSAEVVAHYPGVAFYTDKDAMLAEHPLTELDCYEQPRTLSPTQRKWTRIAMVAAAIAGALPGSWLAGIQDAKIVIALGVAGFLFAALNRWRQHGDLAARRQRLIYLALALWLMAPFAGAAGEAFLRLPLIQVGALTLVQRSLAARAASRFPAEIA